MFDPYHKWLGIPPDQRPPTHYQLLGISPKEKDREVIREAGIRQTAHLRTYQAGPQAIECTKLLNEIARAQTVLLDPAKRKDYDAKLAKAAIAARPKAPPRPVVRLPARHSLHEESSLGVVVLLVAAVLVVAGGVAAFIYHKESRRPLKPPVVEGSKDQPQARDQDAGEVRPVPPLSAEGEVIGPPRLGAAQADPKKDPRTYVQTALLPDPGPELIRPPQVVVAIPPPPPDSANPGGPRLVPLPLEKFATCSSGRGSMFLADPGQMILLPRWGAQEHYGVPFLVTDPKEGQVKNTIMLRGTGPGFEGGAAKDMPTSVKVPCRSPIKVLHLISGSNAWGYPSTPDKSLTMVVRLHFADGSPPEEHELVNGVHFANFDQMTVEAGYKPISVTSKSATYYLRHVPLAVRRPHALVKEIEFVKGKDVTCPLVMAITLERAN